MADKMERQSDFFNKLKSAEDEEFLKQQEATEERIRLAEKETEKKYYKKTPPHQIDPLAGVKLGFRDKKYHW